MTVEERIKEQRDQKLIQLGYCTREYRPDEPENDFQPTNDQYPLYDKEKDMAYRLVVDEVTDEQFRQILAIGGEAELPRANTLSTILTFLAWIGFACFILIGLISASNAYRNELTVFGTFAGIGTGCLLSLLWFAEVLKLLQGIRDKL